MNERPKLSVWIMNSKGGVGKTTLSVAVADMMSLADRIPHLIEVDSRKRLSSFMGEGEVLSFDGAPPLSEIRKNPNAILKHYDPIMSELEKGDSIIDLGANEDAPFLEYCKLSRIDEDLEDMGVRVVVLIPTVTETESVAGAMASIEAVREIVPSARIVLVLNERDGDGFDKYFDAGSLSNLKSAGVDVMTMPRIMSEGWEHFQRAKCRFTDIISSDHADLMNRFGYTRQEAKRARGDMAFWFGKMMEAAVFIPRSDAGEA